MDVEPAAWRGRRVLVTGHTGFKGSWLTLWLASLGAEVTGLSAPPPTTPSLFELAGVGDDVASVEVDVRDPGRVHSAVAGASPEVVFHLAAQPIVRASYADPLTTYAVNVMGTANVLDAVRAGTEARSVIVVTSDKCYAGPLPGRAHVEDDPLGGHDPYSSSKAGAELVASAYRDSFGLPIATARAGNVIGGGDFSPDRIVPDAARAALAGEPLRLRNPEAVRPWQHVLEPLSGYLMLAERALTGAWNFGPDAADARPVGDLVDRLIDAWGDRLRWELDEGDHPHEAGYLMLDSTKARTELGWRPRWGLAEGVAATAEWYAAHRDGGDLRELCLAQIESYARAA